MEDEKKSRLYIIGTILIFVAVIVLFTITSGGLFTPKKNEAAPTATPESSEPVVVETHNKPEDSEETTNNLGEATFDSNQMEYEEGTPVREQYLKDKIYFDADEAFDNSYRVTFDEIIDMDKLPAYYFTDHNTLYDYSETDFIFNDFYFHVGKNNEVEFDNGVNESGDYKSYVKIPVTITNLSDSAQALLPNQIYLTAYTQHFCNKVMPTNITGDRDIMAHSELKSGETYSGYLYYPYVGDAKHVDNYINSDDNMYYGFILRYSDSNFPVVVYSVHGPIENTTLDRTKYTESTDFNCLTTEKEYQSQD